MNWAILNPEITKLVNEWADRTNILASVGPDRGGRTAFWDPVRSKIEANTDLIFRGLTPEAVQRKGLRRFKAFPVATGALYHEAMHARHTPETFRIRTFDVLSPREWGAMRMLEEVRIETAGISHDRRMQPFLRASAMRVMLESADGEEEREPTPAVDALPLTLGRVIGGSLKKGDVEKVREYYVELLDESTVAELESLVNEYIKLRDTEHAVMVDVAQRWCQIAPDKQTDLKDLQDLLDAIDEAASIAGVGAATDIQEDERQARRRARDEERAAARARRRGADEAGQEAKNRDASDVFGGQGFGRSYSSVPFTERKPTGEERRAAVRLAQRLAAVEYSDKHKSTVPSNVPPGRLDLRSVIYNEGASHAGGAGDLPEWRETRRTVVDSPTLRVGMIVDVSGSMSSAMEPMAASNYILATALRRIHAESAVVYMGEGVYNGTVKGTDAVQVWNANAGHENFADAVALLDHDLNFTLSEDGARLAVVASDGSYGKQGMSAACERWLHLLKQQGVAVVWLGYGSAGRAQDMCQRAGATFVPMSGRESPAEVATIIGDAAVKELASKKI